MQRTKTGGTAATISPQRLESVLRKILRGGNFLLVNKVLLTALGPRLAVYVSNLLDKEAYWEAKGKLRGDGSFYLLHQEQMRQTGLTKWELRQCKKEAKDRGLISTEMDERARIEYYSVKLESLASLVGLGEEDSSTRVRRIPPDGEEDSSSHIENKKGNYTSIEDISPSQAKRKHSVRHEQLAVSLVRACSARKALNGLTDTNKWPKQIALLCKALGPPNAEARVHRAIRFLEKMYQQYGMDSEAQYIPTVESVKALREKFDKVEAAMHRSEKGSTGQLAYKDGKYGARKNGEPVDSTRRWFVVADEDPTTGEEFEDDMRLWRNNETDRYVLCPQYPEPLDGELHEDAREVDPALYGIGITA
jgi:hypothetical protein